MLRRPVESAAKTVLPEGNSVEYEYDDAPCAAQQRCTHNVKAIRQVAKPGSGLATLTQGFTYESAFNKVATSTDPRAKVTSYTYTAQGLPLAVTSAADAAGVQPVTTFGYTAYTAAGFPAFYLQTSVSQKTSAASTVLSTTAYNAANKYVPQTVVADAGTGKLNLTSTLTFDAVGNPTQVNGPRTDVTDTVTNVYDAERRVTQSTNALGKLTRLAYDNDGRLIRSAAQVGTQWLVGCRTYSASGKLLKSWGPAQTTADTTCPAAAAPVPVVDYAYDDLDRPMRLTENLTAGEGGNRITETTYHLDDSVQSVQRGVGSAAAQTYAAYTYTGNGLVASVKDAKNNLTAHTYDGHDRKLKTQFPHPTAVNTASSTDYEQYGYDAGANLTSLRKRSGQSITLAYDNLGRLLSRTYPVSADNVTYTYDLLGRRLGATGAAAADNVSYAYDNAGRLASTTAGGRALSYQYDAAGNRTRLTWPDTAFFVTTSYDALNRPTTLKELDTTSLASYAYDDLSRRIMVTLGNGTSTTTGYDAQASLSAMAHNLAGTAQDQTYSYTRNQAREIATHSWSNDLYQWAGVAGNATNGTRSYSANGLNQYTAAAGAAPTHDANGNLTGDGTWTYAYDQNNRLKTASKSGTSAALAYDAEGRLRQSVVAGVTQNKAYDGVDLVAEYDAAGTLQRRWVHGPGVDEPLVAYEGASTANKNWLYADHLGSVVATADATGTNTAVYTYGPYGEPNTTAGQRFRYTGQQLIGGLDVYYYKARFYDPKLGRFLQTDPIGTADDMNLYAYVGGNPVNHRDPSGMFLETAWDVVNIGMGAASLASNVRSGSYGWAAADAVGLVYDTAAAAVPFLPAGAGAGLKAIRAGNGVVDSVNVGIDVARAADASHQAARAASTAGRPTTVGSAIHRNVGNAIDGQLSGSANNFFRGANSASGKQPDLSWGNAPGVWADLTTPGSWQSHVSKYSPGFGEGIPLLYQRGIGLVNHNPLSSFAGVGLTAGQAVSSSGR